MPRLLTGHLAVATHNPGKLAEMRDLLLPFGIEAVSASSTPAAISTIVDSVWPTKNATSHATTATTGSTGRIPIR